MHNIAVIIPVYKQYSELDIYERISLEQTYKMLNSYEICFVTHKEIDVTAYYNNYSPSLKINTFFFEKAYFNNIAGYNRLLLSYEFYKTFDQYKYILICQLDVFVFSDMLDYFTKLNYDYIGAPWFEGFNNALKTSQLIGVGNGGFSLRRVDSFLKILELFNLFRYPYFNWAGLKAACSYPESFLRIIKHSFFSSRKYSMPILPWLNTQYEDYYWSISIKQFFPGFKICSLEDGIAFAFEVNPEILFDLNKQRLPMASHAWQKYDPGFWKPFIEKYGYKY